MALVHGGGDGLNGLAIAALVWTMLAAPPPSLDSLLSEEGISAEARRIGSPSDWPGGFASKAMPYALPHLAGVRAEPLSALSLADSLLAQGRAAGGAEPDPARLLAGLVLGTRLPGFRGLAPRWNGVPPAALEDCSKPSALPPGGLAALPSEGELPESLREGVAELVAALFVSACRVERSWRGADPDSLARAASEEGVAAALPGAEREELDLEDAVRAGGDEERAAAARDLIGFLYERSSTLEPGGEWLGRWEASTPWGRVLVLGHGDDAVRCSDDCLLVLDLGGDDLLEGSAGGARWPEQPVSVVVELAGSDRYRADRGAVAQGAGRGGVGIVLDLAGDDEYAGAEGVQGFGLLGYGILWDAGGSNRFRAVSGAQGAGIFGGGLLRSGAGPDRFDLLGEGQGFGGPGGSGALVDAGGDDLYRVVSDPASAPRRADPHADGRATVANAQGAGVGRRGDLSDGHVWAGGVGALVDLAGDDRYEAGSWAQGVGFWWGSGFLLDAAGDDRYLSVYFSQGSAAHSALGLLLDGAGADVHSLRGTAGASFGYGWDLSVGICVDGGGDDLWEAARSSLGASHVGSFGLFVERGGNDHYRRLGEVGRVFSALGFVDSTPGGTSVGGTGTPPRGAGVFLDLGGRDLYPEGRGGDEDRWRWGRGDGSRTGRGADLEIRPSVEGWDWLGFSRPGG